MNNIHKAINRELSDLLHQRSPRLWATLYQFVRRGYSRADLVAGVEYKRAPAGLQMALLGAFDYLSEK